MILPLTITGNDTDWRTAFNKLESRIVHWSQQGIDGYNISPVALGDGLYYSGTAAISSDPNTTIAPKITNALADTTRGSYISIDRDTGDGDTEYIDVISESNIYLRAFSTTRATATIDLQSARILGNITFSSPGAGANSERYGSGAVAAGASSTAIGESASAAGSGGTATGKSSSASGSRSTAYGSGADAAHTNAVVIGVDAASTANGQFVVGSSVRNITDVYIGSGVQDTNGAATDVAYNASGGNGTDGAGATLILAGGKGTGNATPGSILLKTSTAGESGTTLQTLATRLTISATAITSDATATTDWSAAASTIGDIRGTTTTQTASNGGSYSVTTTITTVFVAAAALTGGQNYTVTLPSAVTFAGRRIAVKITTVGAASSTLTISASAGNVEGGASQVLDAEARSTRYYESDGTDWWAVG